MDVWFDSGAMPFAQDHYPFENKEFIDGLGYPADYISEAIDQTRGWFYTLHAVGVLMGRGKAYKNVICLGHLLDEKGKKMSKSLGNIVDPWSMIEKYGVDTLRLWMYSVNQPGEAKNFDEKTVHILHSQVFGLLYNVLAFYDLYRDKKIEEENFVPKNILDVWIVSRLSELVTLTTEHMDVYKVLEPTRAMRDFMSDLSTWYLRRSRDRIKDGDKDAKKTMYFVLKNLVKVMAPFAPFAAEDIWLKLRKENDAESVHLAEWPSAGAVDSDILSGMMYVRAFVSNALMQRTQAGREVKQPLKYLNIPLSSFTIKHSSSPIPYWSELSEILADEINVKEIILDNKGDADKPGIYLNTEITLELKQEGDYRKLVRAVQDLRKEMGLVPSDVVGMTVASSKEGEEIINKFKHEFKLLKVVGASSVAFAENDGKEIKVDELVFKVKLTK